MVGRQALRMDSANFSGAVGDDSPTSSPSSSPSPDGHRRELQRGRGLQSAGPGGRGRPAAANAARERSRVQTLRTAFLELQRTLPSVPPDTKLSKLDVLILATTYIAHLTRTLQEEGTEEGESTKQAEALHSLKGDGYLHPVKVGNNNNVNININNHNTVHYSIVCNLSLQKWPMRSRLYVGASGQFLNSTHSSESENRGPSSSSSSSSSLQ